MKKNVKLELKNNEGISLVAVLVTVIVVIILLTSIIYSNSRTKEIKQAMLLNSDIEELTKKVELYYLEKQMLPIEEGDNEFVYKEDLNGNGWEANEPKYYRIKLSLLDNVNLNNKEIVKDDDALNDEDVQWYVMNKETHIIYFVQNESGKIVVKKAKYDERYSSILYSATANGIEFNKVLSDSTPAVGNTSIVPGIDNPMSDTTSLGVSSDIDQGTNTSPDVTAATGKYWEDCYRYVGYADDDNWKEAGDVSSSMVLHYDGEFNRLYSNAKLVGHDETIMDWYDISGNDNHAVITREPMHRTVYTYSDETIYETDWRTSEGEASEWEQKSLNLNGNEYVLCDFVDNVYDQNKHKEVLTYNNSKVLKNGQSFTIEIVAEASENTHHLFGTGYYNKTYQEFVGGNAHYKHKSLYKCGNIYVDLVQGCNISRDYCCDSGDNAKIHKNDRNGAVACADAIARTNGFYDVLDNLPKVRNMYHKIYSYMLGINYLYFGVNVEGSVNAENHYSAWFQDYYRGYYSLRLFSSVEDRNHELNYSRYVHFKVEDGMFHADIDHQYYKNKQIKANGVNTFSFCYNAETKKVYTILNGDGDYNDDITEIVELAVPEITIGTNVYDIQGGEWYDETGAEYVFETTYNSFYDGKVYSVRIYNKALSEEEIKKNYEIDVERFGSGV